MDDRNGSATTNEARPSPTVSLKGRFFCSWSGGKDSALALCRARGGGGRCAALLTMMIEDGTRSRSHGLRRELLQAQAESLGVELQTVDASWEAYETRFEATVARLAGEGFVAGVFGDIAFERNRRWTERLCRRSGVESVSPLWGERRETLLDEWLSLGFESRIVALKKGVVPRTLLGRALTRELVDELRDLGIDPSGEGGEYHTVVTDGPIFSRPVDVVPGVQVLRDGYWFQDLQVG